MNIDDIKKCIQTDNYLYSAHAEIERRANNLTFAQIEIALLNSKILEQYEDTGREESYLLVVSRMRYPFTLCADGKHKRSC